jgi:FtsP/CotA-like multicopper oxidase with cupredoxin domain
MADSFVVLYASSIVALVLFASTYFDWSVSVEKIAHEDYLSLWDINRTESTVIHYDWHITKSVHPLDGVERETIQINGMFPGPVVHANVGDTLEIVVSNDMTDFKDFVSLHWHGIKQRGTNHMDGANGITECGIPPGSQFTYRFVVDESGTFWYHSHHSMQRMDGLFGPLIVHDEQNDGYSVSNGSYDDEVIVLLHDHYQKPGEAVYDFYMSRQSGGNEPIPDNGMINGQNVFDCTTNNDPRFKDTPCTPGVGKYAEFVFVNGKKYRLRIINASTFADFIFSVDEHVLTVIEADSTDLKPVDIHYLPIASGQRYSAVVEAKSSSEPVFMRAEMNTECFNQGSRKLDPVVKGIVRFKRESESLHGDLLKYIRKRSLPMSEAWADTLEPNMCLNLDDNLIHPLVEIDAPEADIRIIVYSVTSKLERMNLAPFSFFNRTTFTPAVGAPNLQVELGYVNASDTVPVPTVNNQPNHPKWGGSQLVVEDIPYGSVVELIINNPDDSSHPFHIHGHDLFIMYNHGAERGLGNWQSESIDSYRTKNPIRRDTFTVPTRGNAVVRWVADNPGIWAFHCHILWHHRAGMMMQFVEATEQLHETIPQQQLNYCSQERELGTKVLRPLPTIIH